jgi:excinuclease ABC subunit B
LPILVLLLTGDLEYLVARKQKEMGVAAKNLDFITTAKLRDEILALKA